MLFALIEAGEVTGDRPEILLDGKLVLRSSA